MAVFSCVPTRFKSVSMLSSCACLSISSAPFPLFRRVHTYAMLFLSK